MLASIGGGPSHKAGTRVCPDTGPATKTGALVLGGTVAAGGIGGKIGGAVNPGGYDITVIVKAVI